MGDGITTADVTSQDVQSIGVMRWRWCEKCEQWYQGKSCPVCGKKQEMVGETPRVFYRGEDPTTKKRIRTGDAYWDALLFVSSDKSQAKTYAGVGGHVVRYRAKPTAHILYQGTREFRSIAKGLKHRAMMPLSIASEIVERAEAEGYDAVWFIMQGNIGTAIINPERFVRDEEREPVDEAAFHPSSLPQRPKGIVTKQFVTAKIETTWGGGDSASETLVTFNVAPDDELVWATVRFVGGDYTVGRKVIHMYHHTHINPLRTQNMATSLVNLGVKVLRVVHDGKDLKVPTARGECRHGVSAATASALVDDLLAEVHEAPVPTRWAIRHKGKYWGYGVFGWLHGGWSLMISAEDDELPFVAEYLKTNYGVDIDDVPIVKRLSHKGSRSEFVDTLLEDTAKDMKRMTDPTFLDVKNRKKRVGEPRFQDMEPDDTMLIQVESATTPGTSYTVTVQLLAWEDAKANVKQSVSRRARQALAGDLRLSCSCPAWTYWGFQYIHSFRDTAFGRQERRYPDERNPGLTYGGCKHIARVLDELGRFEYDLFSFLR